MGASELYGREEIDFGLRLEGQLVPRGKLKFVVCEREVKNHLKDVLILVLETGAWFCRSYMQ